MKNLPIKAGELLREDLTEAKGMNISEDFVIKCYDNTVEFILTTADGTRVFGGEVSVSAYENEEGVREVKIGKGSMGPFDITCKASVETTLLMAEMINNFEEFAESCEYVMDRMLNQRII